MQADEETSHLLVEILDENATLSDLVGRSEELTLIRSTSCCSKYLQRVVLVVYAECALTC